MSDDEKLPPRGRFARFRKLATLSAQVGTDVLARGVQRLAGKDPELFSKSAAERLAATLGDMKGAAMKLGQLVSMDSTLVTPEVRAVLARLQNQAPSMPYSTVRKVVRSELGGAPEELFKTFEEVPMAAASLGQVHRATLEDGRSVAVKVQYPGIAEALESDLDNLGLLVGTFSRTSKLLDARGYFEELRTELSLELDYRREASQAEGFAGATRRLPDLKVPSVVAERTSERVLTLELIPGITLREFVESSPSPEERFRVSRLLLRAIYGPFLSEGQIHADPHPGNFLIMPDGRLGVLDFGSVKRFTRNFHEVNARLFRNAVRHEPVDAVSVSRAVGVSVEIPDDEARALIEDLLHIAGRPLHSRDFDYSQDDTVLAAKKHFAKHAAKLLKVRPPTEAVMFLRAIGGLSQNLRLIGARGDFCGIYEELERLIPPEL